MASFLSIFAGDRRIRSFHSTNTLRNWILVLNTTDEEESLVQGGAYIGFMIRYLVEIPKDMVAFNLFKIFHLGYDFSVVVGQAHVIRGLLQIERLNDDTGIANDSQLLNG